MKFEYKISDWESFNNAYLQCKKLLSQNTIEFQKLGEGSASVSTSEHEFNNWHLAEFARFYGSKIFRNNNEIRLVDEEECNLQFEKSEKSQTIAIANKWGKPLEFKMFYLNCAEAYQINILANSLSVSGIERLNENYPELKLVKASFKTSNKYAYQIIDDVLLLICYNHSLKKISIDCLYKIEWHEK